MLFEDYFKLNPNQNECSVLNLECLQTILHEERIKIDICNIQHLLALVNTIGSQFSKHEFLCIKILEAFIKLMPEESNSDPGIIKVQVEKGKDFQASIEKARSYVQGLLLGFI